MPLSKVALHCLESSLFFKQDLLLNPKIGVQIIKERSDSEFYHLYNKYRKNRKKFYEYTKLSIETFDYILEAIEEHGGYNCPPTRVSTTDTERLFLTLRFLAHGQSLKTLAQSYRLGRSTVSRIIYRTLKSIWDALSQRYIARPTQEKLKVISDDFFRKWQFPNCVGSIDKKEFRLMKSEGNEKKHCTLVLQGISDADFKFIAIEIDRKGSDGDGDSFHSSTLNKLLSSNRFNVPPPKSLPNSSVRLPHVLVGDEGYPLKTYLMRPYPLLNLNDEKTVFNERLSRPRVAIELAFAVLFNKWGILTKTTETNTKHSKLIIKVACLLHNIVRERDGDNDEDFMEIKDNFTIYRKKKIKSKRNNRATSIAIQIRNKYKNYFVSDT